MKKRITFIVALIVFVYLLFFPLPTAKMAIKRDLLITDPRAFLTSKIEEGRIKDDPTYGDLYMVTKTERSFAYVKRNAIGWHVTSRGSGP